jgi:hypothetical protein
MPRVVPSDVVKAADRMFPGMVQAATTFTAIGPDTVPRLMALADLVDAVAPELVTLEPERYAALVANVAYIRAIGGAFQAGHRVISLNLEGFEYNPVATIRAAMAACPDEAPTPDIKELSFITDVDLRQSIRLDMSAANKNLAQGEWKGATVLAGSAVEALLLWKIQEHEKLKPGDLAAALAALPQKLSPDPEEWHLHQYIEVALQLKVIEPATATQARQAKDFQQPNPSGARQAEGAAVRPWHSDGRALRR